MQIAEGRIRFSQRLNDMSDELLALSREGERSRKLASGFIRRLLHTLIRR